MFRPALESLEARQTFAADLLSGLCSPMVAMGDVNRDGVAQVASHKLASQLLPYIEQESLHKSIVRSEEFYQVASDAVFTEIGQAQNRWQEGARPQGIIAILIGL